MYKTLEAHIRQQVAPAALRAEFRQHEFEAMRRFCLLIFCVGIAIWLVFDLIVSYLGARASPGFPALHRRARQPHRGARLHPPQPPLRRAQPAVRRRDHLGHAPGDRRHPIALRPVWLVLAVSTVLYTVSVLPVRRWSFFFAMAITWVMLNPFYHTHIEAWSSKAPCCSATRCSSAAW
jgi:hypothetical protein